MFKFQKQRVEARKRLLNGFDLINFETVPEHIVDAFFGSCSYHNRLLVSTFCYLNGLAVTQLFELIRWNDMSQNEKNKLVALYHNFEDEQYKNNYYSYNVHHKLVMYLNGEVRKFGIRIKSSDMPPAKNAPRLIDDDKDNKKKKAVAVRSNAQPRGEAANELNSHPSNESVPTSDMPPVKNAPRLIDEVDDKGKKNKKKTVAVRSRAQPRGEAANETNSHPSNESVPTSDMPPVKNAPRLIDEVDDKGKKNKKKTVAVRSRAQPRGEAANETNSHPSNEYVPTSSSQWHSQKVSTEVNISPSISELLLKKQEENNGVDGNDVDNVLPLSDNANSTPKETVEQSRTGRKRYVIRRKRLIANRSDGGLRIRITRKFSNASTPLSSRQTINVTSNLAESDYDDIGESDDNLPSEQPFEESDASGSDSEEISDDEDIDQTEISTGPQDKRWQFVTSFESKAAVDQFLAKESWWSYRSKNPCTNGTKFLYRCNRVSRSSKNQCEAGVYIIESVKFDENIDSGGTITSFLLYRKNALHTHSRSPEFKQKVSNKVKDLIIEQYRNGRKPKNISYIILDDASVPLKEKPSYAQILRIISNYKNNGSGVEPITMGKLTEFVKKHMQWPNGEDEAFVVKFERSPKEQQHEKFFRFFISTKRLLRNAAKAKILHADATHKVTTEKVPLIVAGVTDKNSKFHFAGMTLANHEGSDDYAVTFEGIKKGVEVVAKEKFEPEVLVCDGDTGIHKAYYSTFGSDEGNDHQHLIIMCYFHVMLNITKKYKFKKSANRKLFKADVRKLHLSSTENLFNLGCKLFVAKWKKAEPEATRLLKKSFFEKFKNWFVGVAPRVPKHNNGLENFNSTMKRCQTLHNRQPLKTFLSTALTIVRQRSLEYLKDKEPFADDLTISDETMKLGRKLDLKFVTKPANTDGSISFFAFSSTLKRQITVEDIKLVENPSFKSFNDFVTNSLNIRIISFPQQSSEWRSARCSCYIFDKTFMCQHIISIASGLGLLPNREDEEPDYDDQPLFQTRRGRPKKTTKAMIKE